MAKFPIRIFPITIAAFFAAITLLWSCLNSSANNTADEATAQESTENARGLSIIFGGDIMQHITQINAAREGDTYDYTECFQYLKPIFDSADLVILNFETTISANGKYTGYPRFAAPLQVVEDIRSSGADVMLFANNHTCDMGMKGIETTVEAFQSNDLMWVGAYTDSTRYERMNPLLIEKNGIKLALLNYTYGTNGIPIPPGAVVNMLDTVKIEADLAKVNKDSVDFIIVCPHWGIEYELSPNEEQRDLAKWLHGRGADFVIGSHPHVIQPVETGRREDGSVETVTAYSLGNLVSNQRERYTDGGMLLKLDIMKKGDDPAEISCEPILTWVNKTVVEGRTRFYILPETVADTLLVDNTQERGAYELFISDGRKQLVRK